VASIYDRLQQGTLKAWGRRSTTYPPAAASHPRPLREFIDASFWKENIIEELEYWLKQPYLQRNKPVLTITKPVAGDRITAIQYWDLVFSATEANHLWPAQRV